MDFVQQHPGYTAEKHNLSFKPHTQIVRTQTPWADHIKSIAITAVRKSALLMYPATFILFSGFLILLAVAALATTLFGMSLMLNLFIPAS